MSRRGLGAARARWQSSTAQTKAGYAAFSVSNVDVKTSHGVNAVIAAAATPAACEPVTERARRNAGQAALGRRTALNACAAVSAAGALIRPKKGAVSSG